MLTLEYNTGFNWGYQEVSVTHDAQQLTVHREHSTAIWWQENQHAIQKQFLSDPVAHGRRKCSTYEAV